MAKANYVFNFFISSLNELQCFSYKIIRWV